LICVRVLFNFLIDYRPAAYRPLSDCMCCANPGGIRCNTPIDDVFTWFLGFSWARAVIAQYFKQAHAGRRPSFCSTAPRLTSRRPCRGLFSAACRGGVRSLINTARESGYEEINYAYFG
jgi:hypothetical protein